MDGGIPEPIEQLSDGKWQSAVDKEFLDVFSDVASVDTRESPNNGTDHFDPKKTKVWVARLTKRGERHRTEPN